MSITLSTRRQGWLVVIAARLYACVPQGGRSLHSPNKGCYANVAPALLDDGARLHPTLHHEVERESKPMRCGTAVLGRHFASFE